MTRCHDRLTRWQNDIHTWQDDIDIMTWHVDILQAEMLYTLGWVGERSGGGRRGWGWDHDHDEVRDWVEVRDEDRYT